MTAQSRPTTDNGDYWTSAFNEIEIEHDTGWHELRDVFFTISSRQAQAMLAALDDSAQPQSEGDDSDGWRVEDGAILVFEDTGRYELRDVSTWVTRGDLVRMLAAMSNKS